MKKKDLNDLKTKSAAELKSLILSLRADINRGRMELAMHKVKNTNFVKNLKKSLAQAKTYLTQKQLEGGNH